MNFLVEFYFEAEMYFILVNTKHDYFRIIFYLLIFKKELQVKSKWISIKKNLNNEVTSLFSILFIPINV